jgi:hypothetical protein
LGTPLKLLKLSITAGLFCCDISSKTSRFSSGTAVPPSAGLGKPSVLDSTGVNPFVRISLLIFLLDPPGIHSKICLVLSKFLLYENK